jgi:hypothetical protein
VSQREEGKKEVSKEGRKKRKEGLGAVEHLLFKQETQE